jgi:large subunit ribosomal protein L21
MGYLMEQKMIDRYAIFQTGGKQYQAIEGKTVAIEKIEIEPGGSVEFTEVLFKKNGQDAFEFGRPYLAGSIKATVIKQDKGPKITVFRFKRRKKVRVKQGHRQPFSIIRIESI